MTYIISFVHIIVMQSIGKTHKKNVEMRRGFGVLTVMSRCEVMILTVNGGIVSILLNRIAMKYHA